DPAGVERPKIDVQAGLPVLGMDSSRPTLSQLFLYFPSSELEPRLVEERTKGVRSRHPQEHPCGVSHDSEPSLGLLHQGVVLEDTDSSYRIPSLVPPREKRGPLSPLLAFLGEQRGPILQVSGLSVERVTEHSLCTPLGDARKEVEDDPAHHF